MLPCSCSHLHLKRAYGTEKLPLATALGVRATLRKPLESKTAPKWFQFLVSPPEPSCLTSNSPKFTCISVSMPTSSPVLLWRCSIIGSLMLAWLEHSTTNLGKQNDRNLCFTDSYRFATSMFNKSKNKENTFTFRHGTMLRRLCLLLVLPGSPNLEAFLCWLLKQHTCLRRNCRTVVPLIKCWQHDNLLFKVLNYKCKVSWPPLPGQCCNPPC